MGEEYKKEMKHKLNNPFTFYYTIDKETAGSTSYEDSIKKIATFETVEEFWAVYQHLIRPEQLPDQVTYYLVCHTYIPIYIRTCELFPYLYLFIYIVQRRCEANLGERN